MRAALGIAIVVALAAAARADDAADRAEAGREFTAGLAADRAGAWQAAIDHYLRANDLVPHPNSMFNIAVDYERLGKRRDAATWFARYLEAAPDAPDADRVRTRASALARTPARLTVRSAPAAARVTLDGRPVGVTPVSLVVEGGAHVVTVERDGRVARRELELAYGEPVDVELTLAPPTGALRVIGTPPGALVMIDEATAGRLPLRQALPPGDHAIRVTQPGYAPFATRARIEPGRETVVDARLPRALGASDPRAGSLQVAYELAVAGGLDARGEGALGLLEFGVHGGRGDVAVRIGRTAGLTAIDLLARWALTPGRFAPFFALGYVAVAERDSGGTGTGALLTGGLRVGLVRGDRAEWALLAETGLRYSSTFSVSGPGDAPTTRGGLVVPAMLSLQVAYR